MARSDVTDALFDPDYCDRLVCERSMQTVGDDGIARNTVTEIRIYGSVQPSTDASLERTPTGERIAGQIRVITKFRLLAGEDGITADVLRWQGRRYTVTDVSDYAHFGRGFVHAICDLMPLSGGTRNENDQS